eukprot:maker-scaffold_11-snap-gene-12.8-mRNA-1 protein AED:0.00 eAED:0.00 QI:36/1/1/1/1/1/2/742/144
MATRPNTMNIENIIDTETKRSIYGGGVVGGICGLIFGLLDGVKMSGLSADYKQLPTRIRDPKALNIVGKQMISTSLLFGIFYSVYQVSKYQIKDRNIITDYPTSIAAASLVACVPVIGTKVFRRNLPYAAMLVALDVYNGGFSD